MKAFIFILSSFALMSVLHVSAFSADIPDSILSSSSRPTVAQIEQLLTTWSPGPLVNEQGIEKDSNKPAPELQNNFPVWFKVLIDEAPLMIATFEKSFPGATWAFIGRDMAIIADLFEAFYRSIGQKDRVVSLGMSSPSLEGLTQDLAKRFLVTHGLNLEQLEFPYILIDAISRGGGRQGRGLLYSVHAQMGQTGEKSVHLLRYFNMIGLRVFTTQAPASNFDFLESLLSSEERVFEASKVGDYFYSDARKMLIYADRREQGTFIGINESGYTHWTGAWHDSFGKFSATDQGVYPSRGKLLSQAMREATVRFQAHVIRNVQSVLFLKKVQKQARQLGFQFPLKRPVYVPKPLQKLSQDLKKATSPNEIVDTVKEFLTYNSGRIAAPDFVEEIAKRVESYLEYGIGQRGADQLRRVGRQQGEFRTKSSETGFQMVLLKVIEGTLDPSFTSNSGKLNKKTAQWIRKFHFGNNNSVEKEFVFKNLCSVFKEEFKFVFQKEINDEAAKLAALQALLKEQGNVPCELISVDQAVKFISKIEREISFEDLKRVVNGTLFETFGKSQTGSQLAKSTASRLAGDLRLLDLVMQRARSAEELAEAIHAVHQTSATDSEKARVVEPHLGKTVLFQSSLARVSDLYSILPSSLAQDLVRRHLEFADRVERYLKIVDLETLDAASREKVISASLKRFFDFKPNVKEVNILLEHVTKNSSLHQTIAAQALKMFSSEKSAVESYRSLVRPKGWHLNSEYMAAKSAFKKAHPALLSRWHPKRWFKKGERQ